MLRIEFRQDGPVMLIAFDLAEYPRAPPAKWHADFNTAQVCVMCIGLRSSTVANWSTNNVGTLCFEPLATGVGVRFRSPRCELAADAHSIRVDEVSAYRNLVAETRSFTDDIAEGIARRASLQELVAVLRRHANLGLARTTAREQLVSLREPLDEHDEDRLLELMDVVEGFCQPDQQVWSDDA